MAFLTAEPVIFCYMLTYGLMILLGQDLILARLCFEKMGDPTCGGSSKSPSSANLTIFSDPVRNILPLRSSFGRILGIRCLTSIHFSNEVAVNARNEAVEMYMGVTLILSLVSIVTSQILGYWMDKISRKTIMMWPALGMVLWSMCYMVIAGDKDLPLELIYLGVGVSSVMGGYITLKSAVTSYIINRTPPSSRTVRLSLIEAFIYLGAGLGFLALYIFTTYVTDDHAILFIGVECVAILNLFYIILVLPSDSPPSTTTEKQKQIDIQGHKRHRTVDYGTFHHDHQSLDEHYHESCSHLDSCSHHSDDVVSCYENGCHDNISSAMTTKVVPVIYIDYVKRHSSQSVGEDVVDATSTSTYNTPPSEPLQRPFRALSAALDVVSGILGMSGASSRYGTPPEVDYAADDVIGKAAQVLLKDGNIEHEHKILEREGIAKAHQKAEGQETLLRSSDRRESFQEADNRSGNTGSEGLNESFGFSVDQNFSFEGNDPKEQVEEEVPYKIHPDDGRTQVTLTETRVPNDESDDTVSITSKLENRGFMYIYCDHNVQAPLMATSASVSSSLGQCSSLPDTTTQSAQGIPVVKPSRSYEQSYDVVDGDENNSSTLCSVCKGIFRGISEAVATTFRRRNPGVRAMIVADIIANFFVSFVSVVESDIDYLYVNAKLNWSFSVYMGFFAAKCGVDGVALLLLLPILRRFLKLQDATLGVLGGISRAAFFILLGSVATPSWVYLTIVVGVFAQYLFVAERAIMTSLVDENEQGRVFTVLSSVDQLAIMSGSLAFDNLFPIFLRLGEPGVTLILGGFMAVVPTVIFCALYFSLNGRRTPQERNDQSQNSLLSPTS